MQTQEPRALVLLYPLKLSASLGLSFPLRKTRERVASGILGCWGAAPPLTVPKGHTSSPSLIPSPLSVAAAAGQGRMGGAKGGTQQDRWTVPGPPACCLRGGRGGVLRDPVSTNVSFRGGEGGGEGERDLFKATLSLAACSVCLPGSLAIPDRRCELGILLVTSSV